MRKLFLFVSLLVLGVVTSGTEQHVASTLASDEGSEKHPVRVHADVIATGIPGAGAITQIGTFHKGGPFADNPVFAVSTQPGGILDRTRLFVASTSNFGAPLARPAEAPGSILSLDISSGVVAVPPTFAAAGGQATAVGGKVILYAAQSPAFVNGLNNPAAATRDLPTVSLPLGISLNNGFGRPWFANAPAGDTGYGTITVIDPSGIPLAGAPSAAAGGVFAGNLTNRNAATTHGLTAPALATALVTKSPDQSGRAVFLAALADGSIEQVHVQRGVDGLAPNASFTPLSGIGTQAAESADPQVVTRVGMLFNWVPTFIAYVTDPLADRILALDLTDDGVLFQVARRRYIRSPRLDKPIDIAAAVPEVGARDFASNTTLGGGSDFYVLNRGNNTIVRMTQEGDVVAVREIDCDVPGFRVNGLTVSEDARKIWVTATAPGQQGVVLQIQTFGAGATTSSLIDQAISAGANGAAAQGAHIFANSLLPEQGLGPLFNARSCTSCHVNGGMGSSAGTFVTRVARIQNGRFDPLSSHGGPIARQHSIAELGNPCGMPTGIPPQANATSIRSAMTLRGTSLIDTILTSDILVVQAAEPLDVRGRLNILADGRPGKFGWKAQTASLVEFMGEAFRDEIGLTNPLASRDLVQGCGASIDRPEADAAPLTSLVAFLDTIDPPVPIAMCLASAGATLFRSVGCANCHTSSIPAVPTTGRIQVRLFSDLLLHDMGPNLADGFEQGSARGNEFRTMPLWRVSDRTHFLHDGRALTILDAILSHGGQAAGALSAFQSLSPADKQSILDFLGCI
jgi:Di-haem oxidoreductase, putative peroxidase